MNPLVHPSGQNRLRPEFRRREFLSRLGAGFGATALAQLLAREGLLADAGAGVRAGAGAGAVAGVRARRGVWSDGLHHPARAKRVIQLFMNGGASQMDLFDYKPELFRRHGEGFNPGEGIRVEAGPDR